MTTNTTPAATLFATTREPSPLALLDYAPRFSFGFSLLMGAFAVSLLIFLGAKALRKKHEADEAERAALEARRRAALAAIDPGTLAQMEALCEAERVIARAQDFAREVTR